MKSPLFFCLLFLAAPPAVLWAQAVSGTPMPPAAPVAAKQEVLVLTPFEVTSAKDTG